MSCFSVFYLILSMSGMGARIHES